MTVSTTTGSGAVQTFVSMEAASRGVSIRAWAEKADDAARLVARIVDTNFMPEPFRGKPEEATAAVLFGAAVGLDPLQALQALYVISGRPAFYARAMLAVTLHHGHEVWLEEVGDGRVVACGQRKGSQRVERATWTMDRARRAGYVQRNKKYESDPQGMLTARAHAEICRRVAPDALLGMPMLTVEELEDEQTMIAGETRKARRRTPVKPVEDIPLPELPALPATHTEASPAGDRAVMASLFDALQINDRAAYVELVTGQRFPSPDVMPPEIVQEVILALDNDMHAKDLRDDGTT